MAKLLSTHIFSSFIILRLIVWNLFCSPQKSIIARKNVLAWKIIVNLSPLPSILEDDERSFNYPLKNVPPTSSDGRSYNYAATFLFFKIVITPIRDDFRVLFVYRLENCVKAQCFQFVKILPFKAHEFAISFYCC